jgi:tryptophan 2,3-dioxygenase
MAKNTYSSYLHIEALLDAQQTTTDSDDELLFIVIHQSHELWFKLAIHELQCAIKSLLKENSEADADKHDCIFAYKRLCRVGEIQRLLIHSWDVLSTLTPDEFRVFRDTVGKDGASGFQSIQYRILEHRLGLKYETASYETDKDGKLTETEARISAHAETAHAAAALQQALTGPSIYDAVILFMARVLPGFAIETTRRGDYSRPYRKSRAVFNAWVEVYANRVREPELYQLGEKLIDLEDAIRKWRFVHLATVSRVIGSNTGTGGSTGLRYLQKAANRLIESPIYPELWDVRSKMFSPKPFDLDHAGYPK